MQTALFPDGSRVRVLTTSAESGGRYVEFEYTMRPEGASAPPHVHPDHAETISVLDGCVEALIDGRWTRLAAGERAELPAGTVHTYRNPGPALARVVDRHEPPGRFEEYMRDIFTTVAAGRYRTPADRKVIEDIWARYPETLRPA